MKIMQTSEIVITDELLGKAQTLLDNNPYCPEIKYKFDKESMRYIRWFIYQKYRKEEHAIGALRKHVEEKIIDWFDGNDNQLELVDNHAEGLLEHHGLIGAGTDFTYSDFVNAGLSVWGIDYSKAVEKALQTEVNVVLRLVNTRQDGLSSHFEEMQCGYAYKDAYLQTVCEQTGIDPNELKKFLSFQDEELPVQQEKSWISGDLHREFINIIGDDNYFCIFTRLTVKDLVEHHQIVAKGSRCGFFDSTNGAGSVLCLNTTRSKTLNTFPSSDVFWDIVPTKCMSYNPLQVYGNEDMFY